MNPKQLTNSRNCSRHSYSNGVLFLRLFLNIIMSIRVNSVSTQHQNTSSPIPTSTVCVSNQHIVFKLRFVIMRVASNGALLHSRDKRFVLDFCLCACFFCILLCWYSNEKILNIFISLNEFARSLFMAWNYSNITKRWNCREFGEKREQER